MVAMVAAGCGFYGDGPQWQEDSRGFSYLVASSPPPPIPPLPTPLPTTSQQQTGAVSTVGVCLGVSAEASCLPEILLPVLGRTGPTGRFLLPW